MSIQCVEEKCGSLIWGSFSQCVYVPIAFVALFKGMSEITEGRCELLSYFLVSSTRARTTLDLFIYCFISSAWSVSGM